MKFWLRWNFSTEVEFSVEIETATLVTILQVLALAGELWIKLQ